MLRKCLLVLIATVVAHHATSLAEAADRIIETSVKLKKPRRLSKRSQGKADEVLMKVWIPDNVKVIRGAVLNPFYLKAVDQKHWQAACRQWDFAIVSCNYFGISRGEFAHSLLQGLKQFAKESKHPELANIPMCGVGMSAGAGMCVSFAAEIPERFIALGPVCLEVGPRNEESYRIPIMTIFGERDGRQFEKLAKRLPQGRTDGAEFAIAVQWRRRHEFGQANNLLFPFFDHVIKLRYPKDADPSNGPVKLLDIPHAEGWLGAPNTWRTPSATIDSFKKYKRNRAKACWLPDQYIASVWQAFVVPQPELKLKLPPGLGDGQPFAVRPAGKPIEVKVNLKKGLAIKSLALYDGDTMVAPLDKDGSGSAKFARGIHALIAVATLEDGTVRRSRPNTIVVE